MEQINEKRQPHYRRAHLGKPHMVSVVQEQELKQAHEDPLGSSQSSKMICMHVKHRKELIYLNE